MQNLLNQNIIRLFGAPVDSPKDCDFLERIISDKTKRSISSTTLRRFFGLLPSKSALSKYNLDTLAIFCGSQDYRHFCEKNAKPEAKCILDIRQFLYEFDRITKYTIKSIARKSLINFNLTTPRNDLNSKLNDFIKSEYSVFPLIAPGGYGKSIALAHWVSRLDKKNLDIIFCSASMFHQFISSENTTQKLKLMPSAKDNLYENFIAAGYDRNLIFVIDSIDELSSDPKKVRTLLRYLTETLNRYTKKLKIKFVVSIRESAWTSLLGPDLKILSNEIMPLKIYNTTKSTVNTLTPLSNSEIREILENYNRKVDTPVLFEFIPWELLGLISVPLNLFLYTSLVTHKRDNTLITPNQLRKEYMKELVFDTKYAEQKEDILWKIIDLIETKYTDFSISKNELKEYFPIHLKRETEYYSAYQYLLASSVLLEEREENQYGIFTTNVKFRHQNFYYYISALNILSKNKVIDKELFISISQSDKDIEWITSVIAILYEIAYENDNFKALEEFCDLPENILSSLQVRFAVGTSFRNGSNIRLKLIRKFAGSVKGQKFFFEEFVDTNYLFNNYSLRIKEYLKQKQTPEALLFGNSILFLAGFLKLDRKNCKIHYDILDRIEPDTSIHPWPIGRKVANRILYAGFIEYRRLSGLQLYIDKYKTIAYGYNGYLEFGLVAFELPVMVSLVLVKEYKILRCLLEDTIRRYNRINQKDPYFSILSVNQNSLPIVFLEFAKYKLGIPNCTDFAMLVEEAINKFITTNDDFQYQIMLKLFLYEYYRDSKNIKKSKVFYYSALDLSRNTGYSFFIALLLNNPPDDDPECIKQARGMIEKSGFNPQLFIFSDHSNTN